jgi:hypothetical protein
MHQRVDRSREQRLRRQAARLDLSIHKSRIDGTYHVIDPGMNCLVAPSGLFVNGTYGFDLDELEEFVSERS